MANLKELQKKIFENKKDKGFNTTDIGKEIILLTEELGELARAYKNSNKKEAQEIDNKEEIVDAIGDIMIYCLGLSEMLEIDSEEVLEKIIKNNQDREHTGNF